MEPNHFLLSIEVVSAPGIPPPARAGPTYAPMGTSSESRSERGNRQAVSSHAW